jgi:drug/metabolite transporter (DMT)-like permease
VRQLSPDARGALYMLLGGAFMTLAHSTFKYVAADLPWGVIALSRHIVGVLCFAPLFLRRGTAAFRTTRPLAHFVRTCFGFASYMTFVYALTRLSFGDTVALSFTAPFWGAAIAILVLREPIVPMRLVATTLGFLGVVLIAKPGGAFHPAMAVALSSALFMSLAMYQVRQLADSEPPDRITFYFMLFGIVLALPFALADWRTPEWHHLPLLAVVGIASFFGQRCLTRGYASGAFSKMAPMDFLRLPWSVAIGFAVFAEVPDPWSILGMAIIALALLAIVRSGRAAPAAAARVAPTPVPAAPKA